MLYEGRESQRGVDESMNMMDYSNMMNAQGQMPFNMSPYDMPMNGPMGGGMGDVRGMPQMPQLRRLEDLNNLRRPMDMNAQRFAEMQRKANMPPMMGAPTAPPKRHESTFVMDISPSVVGWIIGRSGIRIKEIQHQSGCKMWVDQDVPNDQPRKIFFHGSKQNIDAAVERVNELVQSAPVLACVSGAPHKPLMSTIVDCPVTLVGLLIGKKGWTIKKIQQASGAQISINQSVREGLPRKIIVSGDELSVTTALQLIDEVLRDKSLQGDDRDSASPLIFEKMNNGAAAGGLSVSTGYNYDSGAGSSYSIAPQVSPHHHMSHIEGSSVGSNGFHRPVSPLTQLQHHQQQRNSNEQLQFNGGIMQNKQLNLVRNGNGGGIAQSPGGTWRPMVGNWSPQNSAAGSPAGVHGGSGPILIEPSVQSRKSSGGEVHDYAEYFPGSHTSNSSIGSLERRFTDSPLQQYQQQQSKASWLPASNAIPIRQQQQVSPKADGGQLSTSPYALYMQQQQQQQLHHQHSGSSNGNGGYTTASSVFGYGDEFSGHAFSQQDDELSERTSLSAYDVFGVPMTDDSPTAHGRNAFGSAGLSIASPTAAYKHRRDHSNDFGMNDLQIASGSLGSLGGLHHQHQASNNRGLDADTMRFGSY